MENHQLVNIVQCLLVNYFQELIEINNLRILLLKNFTLESKRVKNS